MADRDDRDEEGLAKERMRRLQRQLQEREAQADEDDDMEATAMLSVDDIMANAGEELEEPEERTLAVGGEEYERALRELDGPAAADPPASRRPVDGYHYDEPEEPEERTMMATAEDAPSFPPAAEEPDLHDQRTMMAPQMVEPLDGSTPRGILTVLMGPDQGQRYLLGEGVSYVGRALECQAVLKDASASRKHFRIEHDAGRYVLIDMGSENGTCVNGARVDRCVLEPDAQISVGTTLLHFGYLGAPPPTLATTTARDDDDDDEGGGAGKAIAIGLVLVLLLGGTTLFVGEKVFGWWNIFGMAPSAKDEVAKAEPKSDDPTETSDASESDGDDGDDGDPAGNDGDDGDPASDDGDDGDDGDDPANAPDAGSSADDEDAGEEPEEDTGTAAVVAAGADVGTAEADEKDAGAEEAPVDTGGGQAAADVGVVATADTGSATADAGVAKAQADVTAVAVGEPDAAETDEDAGTATAQADAGSETDDVGAAAAAADAAGDDEDAGTATAQADAGDDEDAGVAVASADAGADAGDHEDAGVVVASADAGSDEDTGAAATVDAGAIAAVAPDAGSPEADAGDPTEEDAGTAEAQVDAGEPDAGTIEATGDSPEKLLLDAKLLLGEKKLDQAQQKLGEALKAKAPRETVLPLMKLIGQARADGNTIKTLTEALARGQHAVVLKSLVRIKPTSPYASDAADLASKARAGLAKPLLAEAKALAAKGDKDGALGKIKEALKLAPGHPDGLTLQKELAGAAATPDPVPVKGPQGEDETEADEAEAIKKTVTDFVTAVAKKDDKAAKELLLTEEECSRLPAAELEKCKKEVKAMGEQLDRLRKDLKGTAIAEVADPDAVDDKAAWGALPAWNVEVKMAGGGDAGLVITVVRLDKETLRVTYAVEEVAVPTAPTAKTLETRRGFRLYGSGNFAGASRYFARQARDDALDDSSRAKARGISKRIKEFQGLYGPGMAAANAMQALAALSKLNKALNADRRINGHYQRKIKKALAKMHVQRAGSKFVQGNLYQAAKSARKALSLDRSSAQARAILKKIDPKVSEMIGRARKAKAAGNTYEAKRILRKLKLILGKRDSRRKQVIRLLDSLK